MLGSGSPPLQPNEVTSLPFSHSRETFVHGMRRLVTTDNRLHYMQASPFGDLRQRLRERNHRRNAHFRDSKPFRTRRRRVNRSRERPCLTAIHQQYLLWRALSRGLAAVGKDAWPYTVLLMDLLGKFTIKHMNPHVICKILPFEIVNYRK